MMLFPVEVLETLSEDDEPVYQVIMLHQRSFSTVVGRLLIGIHGRFHISSKMSCEM
jgi:hypothetical protein